jgi:hypothetical protein
MIGGIFIYRFYYGGYPKVAVRRTTHRMRQLIEEHPEYDPVDIIGFVNIRNKGASEVILDNLIELFPDNISTQVITQAREDLESDLVYVPGAAIKGSLKEAMRV